MSYLDTILSQLPEDYTPPKESEQNPNVNKGALGDTWTSTKIGMEQLPGTVAGLADVVTAPLTGDAYFTKGWRAVDRATLDLEGRAKRNEAEYSDQYREGQRNVNEAWKGVNSKDGTWEEIKSVIANSPELTAAYLKNPGYTIQQVVQSLPSMAAGGVGSRAVLGLGRAAGAAEGMVGPGALERTVGAKYATPVAAGVGEGGVAAGQNMSEIDPDAPGYDARRAALSSMGAGMIDAGITAGFGRAAQRLGLETLETKMAGGAKGELLGADGLASSWKTRIPSAAATEGAQEFAQSVNEAGMQNVGEGRGYTDSGEGPSVLRQGIEGMLSGGLMGAGANLRGHGKTELMATQDEQYQQAVDSVPSVQDNTPQGQQELNFGMPLDRIDESGARNPYDVGGHVTAFQGGSNPSVDGGPQGSLFNGPVSQQVAAHQAAQPSPEVQAQQQAAQQAEQQKMQAHAVVAQRRAEAAQFAAPFGVDIKNPGTLRPHQIDALLELKGLVEGSGHNPAVIDHVTPVVYTAKSGNPEKIAKEMHELKQTLGIAPPAAGASTPAAPAAQAAQQPAAPAKPADLADLPRYQQEMQHYLTEGLRPEELHALVGVEGANKDSAGDEEVLGSSLRALAKSAGVSHETIRTRHAAAMGKIAAQAERAGIDLDTAKELLGMQSSHDIMDVGLGSGGHENGRRVATSEDATAANDDFEHGHGMERAEAASAEETPVEDETAHDALDAEAAQVEAVPNEWRTAELDYNEGLEPGEPKFAELPKEIQNLYAQALDAFNDSRVTAQQMQNIYNEVRDENRKLAAAAPVGKAEEKGTAGPDQERDQAGGAGKTGPKVSVKKRRAVAAPEAGEVEKTGTKFSRAAELETSGDKLQEAIEKWKGVVESYLKGDLDKTKTYTLLPTTPASMQAMGLPNLEVRVGTHALSYANVRLTKEQMVELPRMLAQPRMVYIHEGQSGPSINFVTNVENSSGVIVVALKPNMQVRGMEPSKAHFVATILNVQPQRLVGEARNGHALYVESKDGITGLRGALDHAQRNNGNQAREVRRNLSDSYGLTSIPNRVLYKTDLVKLIEDGRALYSSGEGAKSSHANATSIEAIKSAIGPLFLSKELFSRRVQIVESAEELAHIEPDLRSTDQAFVKGDKAYLIAGNIPKGAELAVFLHEVGGHLGMETLIGRENIDRLSSQIKSWASSKDNTTESQLARRALSRAEKAGAGGMAEEHIAYFIEEAVKSGINPVAETKRSGPIADFFRMVVAAMKVALNKMGMNRFESLTAQNVVDLAMGAADLALSEGTVSKVTGEQKAAADAQDWADIFGGAETDKRPLSKQEAQKAARISRLVKIYGGKADYGDFKVAGDAWAAGLRAQGFKGEIRDAELSSLVESIRKKSDAFKAALFGRSGESGEGKFKPIAQKGPQDPLVWKRKVDTPLGKLTDGYTALFYYNDVGTGDPLTREEYENASAPTEATLLIVPKGMPDADAGALKLTISKDGEFVIHGPPEDSELYDYLHERGMAELATGGDGTVHRYGNGLAWTRLTGVTNSQLLSLMGETHALVTGTQGLDHMGMYWQRATGATGVGEGTELGRTGATYFSRDYSGAVKTAAASLAGETGQKFVDDTTHAAAKAVRSFASLYDIVGQAKKALPSARDWYEAFNRSQEARHKMEREAEKIAGMARDLPNAAFDRVNEFLADSTFNQKWGHAFGWKKDIVVDPEYQKKWEKLSPQEQAVAEAVFKHGEESRQRTYKMLEKLGVSDALANFGKLEGPYAPLKRFGNYVATLKSKTLVEAEKELEQNPDDKKLQRRVDDLKRDEDHFVSSTFDTMGQAQQFKRANEKDWHFSDVFERSKHVDTHHTMDYSVLQRVMSAVKADPSLPANVRDAMEETVKALYTQAAEDHSARQMGAKRKFRAGYDKNMIRSFLTGARAGAIYQANLEHGGDINDAFYRMQREAKNETGHRTGQDLFNTMAEHYAENTNYKPTPFQDMAVGLTSAIQLSTSLGYHLSNASQAVMVTIPKIAGDFNDYTGSWGALMEGYRVVGQVMGRGKFHLEKVQNPALRAALEHASNLGILDVGMEEDLGQFDRMRTGYAGVDQASKLGSSVMHRLRSVARFVEGVNRVSSAVAAYNMAKKHGRSEAQAAEYVMDVLHATQGDFSRAGAPLVLKKLPKVMVQYRKYQLMMAAFYVKAFHAAFNGATQEERAVGRRMLAFKLFHTSMAAGVLGWPLMNLAALTLGFMGGGDGPDKDLEQSLRDAIGDKDLANIVLHGLPSYLGLDLNQKLGDNNIFSIAPYTEFRADSAAHLSESVAGVVGGPALAEAGRMASGIGLMEKGEYYKGVEKFVPKGIESAMQAFRFANDGYTLNNGDVVVKAEDIDAVATLLTAIGMPATQLKEIQRQEELQREISQFYSDRSKELEQEYAKAYRANDTKRMDELRDEWKGVQATKAAQRPYFNNVPNELRVQPLSTLLRYPHTVAKRERKEQRAVAL